MKNITSRNSASQRLGTVDARVKLAVALSLLLMVVSSTSFIFPLLTAAMCLGLCLFLKVRIRLLLTRFAEPLFIAAVVLVMKALGTGSAPLWGVHLPFVEITVYKEG